jgi:uncharacterized membrane protein YjfL (UPF0719 family)
MTTLAVMNWERLGIDVVSSIIFGVIGIGLMILGYKAFDWVTPRLDVEKELMENKNMAVAVVVGAVFIGVSILIAHIVSA